MLVRSKMTADVITASPTTSIADALKLTRGNRIRHLPIVQDGNLVGLVTDRDLRLAMPPIWASDKEHIELRNALVTKTTGDVMITEIITTSPDTPIEDAARKLYEHRIGCLPVIEAEQMIGIVTETDVLRAFVELFGAEESGSRLEVLMEVSRPGELARVVRAIGVDFKLHITGIVLSQVEDGQLAVVHVSTGQPEELIEHLRRLGYRVGCPSLDLEPEHVHETPASIRHWAAEGF